MQAIIATLLLLIFSLSHSEERQIITVIASWSSNDCSIQAENLSDEEAKKYLSSLQNFQVPLSIQQTGPLNTVKGGRCPFHIGKYEKVIQISIGDPNKYYRIYTFDITVTPIKYIGASPSPARR